MILNDNEGTFWEDTNGGKHYNDRSVRIVLHDYHREYTGVLDALPPTDGGIDTHVRAEVIWDHFAIEGFCSDLGSIAEVTSFPGAYGDQQAEKAWSMIDPSGVLAKLIDCDMPQHLWLIEGRPKGLERAFDCLAAALDVEDGVHGDDDAFDYWPNTMDMLYDFATDLDKVKKNDLHTTYVRQIAQRVLDRTAKTQSVAGDTRELMLSEWGRTETWMKGVS